MRLMASLGHYLATTADDVLYLHQFAGADVGANLSGGLFRVEMTSRYPWSGSVDVEVRGAPPDACGLAVRIPAWCRDARFRVNGSPVAPNPADRGYLVVRRHWMPGDVLRCELDLAPRLTDPSRRIDALRGTAAVERGPLVYCFEQADQPAEADLEDLVLDPQDLPERDADLPGVGGAVTVAVAGQRLAPAARDGLPYQTSPDTGAAGAPVTAVAIPYFQWDNRDGRAMRVWMPRARSARNNTAAGRSPAAGETL
jgi:uncharacterized protein